MADDVVLCGIETTNFAIAVRPLCTEGPVAAGMAEPDCPPPHAARVSRDNATAADEIQRCFIR
jgi:hypothetical protein